MKVRELKKLCKENKIKGYSKLKKKDLVNKLQNLKMEEGPAPTKPMSPLLKRIKRKL